MCAALSHLVSQLCLSTVSPTSPPLCPPLCLPPCLRLCLPLCFPPCRRNCCPLCCPPCLPVYHCSRCVFHLVSHLSPTVVLSVSHFVSRCVFHLATQLCPPLFPTLSSTLSQFPPHCFQSLVQPLENGALSRLLSPESGNLGTSFPSLQNSLLMPANLSRLCCAACSFS